VYKAVCVCLTGANVIETAKALATRLVEMGRGVELLDQRVVERLGGHDPACYASGLLTRNGVIVIITVPGLRPETQRVAIEIDEHDTPDFAADKILDELARENIVILEDGDYSPEEEEQIRARLSNLGYIE